LLPDLALMLLGPQELEHLPHVGRARLSQFGQHGASRLPYLGVRGVQAVCNLADVAVVRSGARTQFHKASEPREQPLPL